MLSGLKPSDILNDEEYFDKNYAKIVNYNIDGASVMSGRVQTRIKEMQNGLIYMHCTAHQFVLAVRDSRKLFR